jgi:hypothetical protein
MGKSGSDWPASDAPRPWDDDDEGLFVEGKTVLDPDGGAVAEVLVAQGEAKTAWLADAPTDPRGGADALVARDASRAIDRMQIDEPKPKPRPAPAPQRPPARPVAPAPARPPRVAAISPPSGPVVMAPRQFVGFEEGDRSRPNRSGAVDPDGMATVVLADSDPRPRSASRRERVTRALSLGLACLLAASLGAGAVIIGKRFQRRASPAVTFGALRGDSPTVPSAPPRAAPVLPTEEPAAPAPEPAPATAPPAAAEQAAPAPSPSAGEPPAGPAEERRNHRSRHRSSHRKKSAPARAPSPAAR